MVYRDGGGSGSITPLYGSAVAAKGTWFAGPLFPADGDRPSQLKPTLTAAISASGGGPSSVQWDVSTNSGFTAIIWTLTETSVPNQASRSVTMNSVTLTNLTTYYWRVRAGDGAGVWGPFSTTRTFTPDLNAGRGYLGIYENVGIELLPSYWGVLEAYENVGLQDLRKGYVVDTHYYVVSPEDRRKGDATDQMYFGDVNTQTPTPHIWWIKPAAGRAGDGIQIVCFGAGDLQSTFSGVVEIYMGAAGGGWQPVSVNTWQVFPPTVNAYTSARTLDEAANVIDMQHQVIEITVPAGSVPPGYPLRLRTEGP
jgi:hypothetical protein